MRKVYEFLIAGLIVFIPVLCHSQTDQELVWASYFGADGMDYPVEAVTTDDGGVLFVGYSTSTSGLTTTGSHQPFYQGGDSDGVILKINSDKEKEWATYFGGDGSDGIYSIDLLSDGSFVIVGDTWSEYGIATLGTFMEELPAYSAAFVARFSAEGEQLWGTYLGGTGSMYPGAYATTVAVDDQDNIIVGGKAVSPDFPTTENAYQDSLAGDTDGFIVKFDMVGNLLWSTYFGGTETDEINNLLIDSSNEIVLFGYTESASGIATPLAHQSEYGGEGDAFLARFSPDGARLWGTYYGGSEWDRGGGVSVQCIALDNQDNIYVRTESRSAEGMVTQGATIEDLLYNESVVLARFSIEGELMWATYFGANVSPPGGGIILLNNQVIIGGCARMDEGYLMGTPYQSEHFGTANSGDMFFAGFDLDGNQLWGTYFGGGNSDLMWHLAPYSENQFVFAGNTQSGIPMPDNAFQPIHGGIIDGILGIFDISNVTSVGEKEAAQLSIFPNPTTSHIRLQLPPEFAFRAAITVYNATGQVVARNENFNSLDPLPMNYPPGMYVVEARSDGKVVRGKVIVE